jgi:hypothetical protein
MSPVVWRLKRSAAKLMTLMSGMRLAFGLFVAPLNPATGMGPGALSLVLALGQLAIGLTQPLLAVIDARVGATRAVVLATLAFALPAAWPPPALVATTWAMPARMRPARGAPSASVAG